MNNILPSNIKIHQKFDLKGSTYKREASPAELEKKTPTFKDIDFLRMHPNGIILEEKHFEIIMKSIQRDCRFLESFEIMDYSLLLGIHNLEKDHPNKSVLEAYYKAKLSDLHSGENFSSNNNQNDESLFPGSILQNAFNM
jgi:hypothetical protein